MDIIFRDALIYNMRGVQIHIKNRPIDRFDFDSKKVKKIVFGL